MVRQINSLTRRRFTICAVGFAIGLSGCSSRESKVSEEEKVDIVESYSDAIDQYDEAMKNYDQGGDAWEREDFRKASSLFDMANVRFETAVEDFREVEDTCYSIGNSDAADICSESAQVCRSLEDASLYIRRAAEAYEEGDYESGSDNYDRYNEQHQNARQMRIRSPQVLANTLGLDTE